MHEGRREPKGIFMRITSVSATPFHSSDPSHGPSWLSSTVIANPMSKYPQYYERRSSWGNSFPSVLIRIGSDAGLEGIGTAVGGRATAAIVEEHLAKLLVGQDPSDVECLWDQMFRSTLPYGRKGLPVMAISGVDHALWDLLGKAAGVPVYRLLGGACRADLPVYETTNDRDDWREHDGAGIKLAVPYGPTDGRDGLRRNAALVRECRETLGPDKQIMLDCYMAFDVEYTRRLIDLVEPLEVRWLEEPLAPDDYRGWEQLGRIDSPVAIATGEHEYTRWGFTTLIGTGGVTVLQPDVAWVGGITETIKICHLASSYHLDVVPHAGGLQAGALHVMKSQSNTPLAEWVRTWDRATGRPAEPITGVPDPESGRIRPSDAPGLGIAVGDALVAEG
jgi:L-rhamnonate dehydratase